jgi:nitrile hydratase accessory protein
MTILNQPDELAFSEPWEAQAFALAVKLSEQGYFTWKEWSEALAAEIKNTGQSYYQSWLHALEKLVIAKGLTTPEAIETRKQAWANAYRHTPHGKPVVLHADQ